MKFRKIIPLAIIITLGLSACSEKQKAAPPAEKTAESSAAAPTQAKVGEAAPEFSARDWNDAEIKLQDLRGKYVVLEWFNTDCPYVRKHYDSKNMQTLQKELTEKAIVWLTVFSSAPGKQGHADAAGAKAIMEKEQAAPNHVLLDPEGKLGRLYGAKTTPHMYIVDPQGKLAYMGAIDSISSFKQEDIPQATNYVRQAIDELMAGKAVSVAATQAYGCSVKY